VLQTLVGFHAPHGVAGALYYPSAPEPSPAIPLLGVAGVPTPEEVTLTNQHLHIHTSELGPQGACAQPEAFSEGSPRTLPSVADFWLEWMFCFQGFVFMPTLLARAPSSPQTLPGDQSMQHSLLQLFLLSFQTQAGYSDLVLLGLTLTSLLPLFAWSSANPLYSSSGAPFAWFLFVL
jgi:hypothetical protein